MDKPILDVKNFSVSFHTYAGEVQAVRNVSFSVQQGERLAIVGESGSGKSVMTQSLVKLLPSPPASIKGGQILYNGSDISGYSWKQLRSVKGAEIAYIFQDPMTSLNPTIQIGKQIIEGIQAHSPMDSRKAQAEALTLLRDAGISNPEKRMKQYPYELSGGMRQRVMIAMSLGMRPKLLVADEPTTALDVTIQSQILRTLKKLNEEYGMALILITHDMGIVAGMAQRVAVMYGGCIVEMGTALDIFENPCHPYTYSLLNSVPRLDIDTEKPLEYIVGSPPDMLSPPAGCPFAPRCRFSMEICYAHMPATTECGANHIVHCWLSDERANAMQLEFEEARKSAWI
ncbi:ABC transporter ATP-binding protein [Clostridia bacterium]|nr:ABC transporter ATP-binding protein [Clostridia bacterium]